jgi:hypothetical protein
MDELNDIGNGSMDPYGSIVSSLTYFEPSWHLTTGKIDMKKNEGTIDALNW